MITKAEAERRARAQIETWLKPDQYRVLDSETLEEGFGWVFFYESTGASPLAGNAPIVVLRDSGQVRVTGTALPIEEYLAELRRE